MDQMEKSGRDKEEGLDARDDWLFAGKDVPNDPNGKAPFKYMDPVTDGNAAYTDWRSDGHGTAVFAKAVGPDYGVSKEANFTIVRIPQAWHSTFDDPPAETGNPPRLFDTWRWATVADGLNMVRKDFLKRLEKDSDYKAVVGKRFSLMCRILR